jgi:hypothetical protein
LVSWTGTSGLDLNGDGTADDQLATALRALGNAGVATAQPVYEDVANGTLLQLAELRTVSLANADAAEFVTYRGIDPSPLPCAGSDGFDCGRHLMGTGKFTALGAPGLIACSGPIRDSALICGGGRLPIRLVLAGGVADVMALGVRARSPSVADSSSWLLDLGGAISAAQVNTAVYPALAQGLTHHIESDCSGTGPSCGCKANSSGAAATGLDIDHDCIVSVSDLRASPVASLLAPDIDTDGDLAPDALSFALHLHFVSATFETP